MARLAASMIILSALLCAVAVDARRERKPLLVKGRVYCDTCQAGFETSATTYIPGARVRVLCKDRETNKPVYEQEATTDSSGTYKMLVAEDHLDQLCDAMLISSPLPYCKNPAAGRDRARVILTRFNGIASDDRFVNSMGFTRDEALAGCAEVLQQYQETDE